VERRVDDQPIQFVAERIVAVAHNPPRIADGADACMRKPSDAARAGRLVPDPTRSDRLVEDAPAVLP
jgi:hypothetical protein